MIQKYYDRIINDVTCIYGYVVAKDTYKLEHINIYLLKHLGIDKRDTSYQKKNCYEVIYKSDKPCDFCNMNIMNLNEERKWYRCVKNKDVKTHLAVKDALQSIDNQVCFIVSIYNINEEVNQVLNLQSIVNLEKAVKSCTKVLSNESDTKSSNEKLLRIVSDFYDCDSAYIYKYNKNLKSFSLDSTHYADKTSHKVSKNLKFDDEFSKDLFEKDYITLSKHKHGKEDFFKELGGNSMNDLLLAPIKIDDNLSGLVGVNNFDDRIPNFEFISMVSSFVSNNFNMDNIKKNIDNILYNAENSIDSNMVLLDCVKALLDESENNNDNSSVKGLLEVLLKHYQSDRVYFFECDTIKNSIKNINEVTKSDINSCVPSLKSMSNETLETMFSEITKKGQILFTDCKTMIDSNTYEYKLILKNNVDSILMIPLLDENNLKAIICVENLFANINDVSLLKSVSSFVVSHMHKTQVVRDLEELSFNDDLTGLYNRNFYINYIDQVSTQIYKKMGIIYADVNGLKKANDNLGHEYGDILIKWCANFLKDNTDSLVFRFGGDELVCFFENVTKTEFEFAIRRLQHQMDKLGRRVISFGSTWRETNTDIRAQIAETDHIMYKSKQEFYRNLQLNPVDEAEDLENFKQLLEKFKSEL